MIRPFVQLKLTLWIPTDSRTDNPYAYLIFLVSRSCFCFLCSLPESLLALTVYDEHEVRRNIRNPGTISLACSLFDPIMIQSIVLFCGRLSSEYQVVRNQLTPVVIVQIVLDLVNPNPFYYACCTYFRYKHSPSRINCAQLKFNICLLLC